MDQLTSQEWNKKIAQIIAKAWADASFKQRLVREPTSVLKEYGLEPPAGIEISVVENTEKHMHLILPSPPGENELSEEDLAAMAAGADSSGSCQKTPPPPNPLPPIVIEFCVML